MGFPFLAGPSRAGFLLLIVTLVAGCAGHGNYPQRDTFAQGEVAPAALIESAPFYAQEAYQCGPAALAMMLNHREAGVTLEETVDRVYLPARQGSLQVEMVAAARSKGMLVYPLEKRLESVIREVDAGNPVLVFQNLRLGWWPQWHYAVVVGYDLAEQEFVLHSGTEEQKVLPFRLFDNTWAKADRWARVVMPPGELPATAEPVAYVRAAHDLEEVGQDEAARASYEAALEAWPDSLAAGFARANQFLSQQQWQQAEEAFRRLLAFHPQSAPAWYNLGVTLEQNQCPGAAHQAHRCARALAPEDGRFANAEGNVLADRAEGCSLMPLLDEAGCSDAD